MMNNDGFDVSVESFLKTLGLPANHPYVEQSHEAQNDDIYHEGRGHKEWSVFDYFTPHGHATVAPNKAGGKQDLPSSSSRMFSFFAKDECPAPSPLTASFSSDAVEDGSKRYDWLYAGVALTRESLSAARHVSHNTIETFYQVWPSFRGSFHLTLRLFAPLILFGAVLYLIVQSYHDTDPHFLIASCIALSTMLLMMTDECYIQEYGRVALASAFCGVLALVVRQSSTTRESILLTAPFIALAITISLFCHIYVPSFKPGFYYSHENPLISAIASQWPVEKRTYDGRGTPWLVTGDSRTGIPFFLDFIPKQRFVRRWVPSNVAGEREACILDIAFPPDGIHRTNRPIYLILHGLNGGSNEEYVKDFVMRSTANGSTVAILVTRGLMDSPVLGENLPHFARMSDIDATARVLRKAATPHQLVAGVGYSMGAIDLATFVATTGKDCPLNVAVSISGALDTRKQVDFHRSKRYWQPMLSKTLRDTFVEKFADRLAKRLSQEEMNFLSKIDSLVTLDEAIMVPYNQYKDIDAYYADMGAMGDFQSFEGKEVGRIANVSIPLIMISALDDPIGFIETLTDPEQVVETGDGYTMILLTRTGGHVGWPLGWNQTKNAWRWMSEAATSFVESADLVFKQQRQVESDKIETTK